jgi:vitamin K-dependent gamma-carboxylase
MLFDLSVGFLLFSQRTLPLALLGLLAFNLTNHWLFRIGIFPFLVLGSAILFAPPDLPRRLLGGAPPAPAADARPRRGLVLAALGLYVAVQVLLPLRHFLYRGSASWTEEGHRFSWHMKLRAKRGQVTFEVIDRHSGEIWRVDPAGDLTRRQLKRMTGTPDMLVQYAHWLARRYRERGVEDPIVRADTWVSLNRRPPQRLIDPTVDLGRVRVELLSSADWIVPLDAAGRPGHIARAEFTRLGMRPPVPRE